MPERHKIQNWSDYNRSLKNRGNIFFFIEEKLLKYKKKHNQQYSDAVVIMCHQVKYLLKLPYRQTEGFLTSLVKKGFADLGKIPNYSTMCRRASNLDVQIKDFRKNKSEAIAVAIDSTGIHVYNMSDWRKESNKRLYSGSDRYKKLHVMIDLNSREVIDLEITSASGAGTGDISVGNILTKRLDLDVEFLVADAAYSKKSLYRIAHEKGISNVVLPPSIFHIEGDKESESLNSRNEAIKFLNSFNDRKEGLKIWKKKSGYHIRSRIESFMARFKRSFGKFFYARTDIRRKNEAIIKAILCNKFLELGMPISQKIY